MLRRRPASVTSLAPDQKQADAIATERPTLVLGGPGTGKTTVAIEHSLARIRGGLDPKHLLVLTYGRERAAFLRDEIAVRGEGITREPIARTIHAFCYGVLRRHALENGMGEPVLLSGPEQDATIRELLEGDAQEGFTSWPKSLEKALTKRAFARELRDLLSRATERNLSPSELRQLGEEMGREEWIAAAAFYERYRGIFALRETYALDPSAIVVETISLLDENPELLARLRDDHQYIVVDEFHESDPSHRALLRLLTAGRPFLLTADPDSSVLRFRGAAPETVRSAADELSSDLVTITLDTDHRSATKITDLGVNIARRFRGVGDQRERTSASPSAGRVDVATVTSVTAEARYVALRLREAHLRDGIEWSQMAVLLRSPSGRLAELQRACALAGVPVVVNAEALALAEQPAVRPLLLMARAALDPGALTHDDAEALLLSPYGGADALGLRAIRQEFRSTGSPSRSILDGVLGHDAMADLDARVVAPIKRIAALIESARKSNIKGAQAEDMLWAIWSKAGDDPKQPLGEQWRRRALAGGVDGQRADRDLDAVVALFEMAARFADRKAGATPDSFFDELLQQEIPGDTIAAKAQRSDVVEILTVHSAKGREWDVVAVMGVQEGQWPNLKLRGSLLGSELLIAAVERGTRSEEEVLRGATPALLDDERRLFHVAITRARSQVIITAVRDKDDHRPSQFFEEVSEFEGAHVVEIDRVPRQLTMPALVASLRHELNGPHATEAAAVLAMLRAEGVTTAEPSQWWGALPLTSDAPVIDPEHLWVSPSAVESFETCQLRWFLERHGGTPGESSAQSIGTAVHKLAERLKEDADLATLQSELDRIWPELDEIGGWFGDREKARVSEMIEKLVAWHQNNSRRLHNVELKFDDLIEGVRLVGKIDRVEFDEAGNAVVVDLKTSKTPMSKTDAQENPQLSLYQLALNAGLLDQYFDERPEVAGAELVYPASGKSAATRNQAPIDIDQTTQRLVAVATGMASSAFDAVVNDQCAKCPAQTSCPVRTNGRTVLS